MTLVSIGFKFGLYGGKTCTTSFECGGGAFLEPLDPWSLLLEVHAVHSNHGLRAVDGLPEYLTKIN